MAKAYSRKMQYAWPVYICLDPATRRSTANTIAIPFDATI
jgi:hypothetical protein